MLQSWTYNLRFRGIMTSCAANYSKPLVSPNVRPVFLQNSSLVDHFLNSKPLLLSTSFSFSGVEDIFNKHLIPKVGLFDTLFQPGFRRLNWQEAFFSSYLQENRDPKRWNVSPYVGLNWCSQQEKTFMLYTTNVYMLL